MIKTSGRLLAIEMSACLAVLYKSAAGVNGKPYDMLIKVH